MGEPSDELERVYREQGARLWRAAFRIAAGDLKDRRTREPLEAGGSYEMPESRADVLEALGELSPRQRAALLLHDYAGYSAGDAGAIFGLTAGTVRVHITLAGDFGASWRTAMRDLVPELRRRLDAIEAPDLWSDIGSREPGPPRGGPSAVSRIGGAILALAVAAGGFALASLTPSVPSRRPSVRPPESRTALWPSARRRPGW